MPRGAEQLPLPDSEETRLSEVPLLSRREQGGDVLDLRFLFREFARRWKLIILLAVIGGVYGLYKMHTFTPSYAATMTVLPETGQQLLTDRGGNLPGVATALGFAIGGKETTALDRLELAVGSVALAQELQQKHQMLQVIFKDSWDPETRTWLRPSGTWFELKERIRSFFKLPTWSSPDVETLAAYLKGAVVFTKALDSEFWEIRVEHPNPELARFILETTYFAADDFVREQDRARVTARKAYLEKRMHEASLTEMRQGLVHALMGEEQKAMLLSADLPYAARIVDPITLFSRPSIPSMLALVVAPMLGAILLALVAVTLIATFRAESD